MKKEELNFLGFGGSNYQGRAEFVRSTGNGIAKKRGGAHPERERSLKRRKREEIERGGWWR